MTPPWSILDQPLGADRLARHQRHAGDGAGELLHGACGRAERVIMPVLVPSDGQLCQRSSLAVAGCAERDLHGGDEHLGTSAIVCTTGAGVRADRTDRTAR